MPNRRLRFTLIIVAAHALAGSETALAVVIDDFTDGPISLVHSGLPIVHDQTGLDPAHVVGGARHFTIGQGGGSNGQSVTIDTIPQRFAFESGPGLGYLQLTYGSSNSPLEVDLTAGGSDRLVLLFEDVNPPAAISAIRMTFTAATQNPGSAIRNITFEPPQVLSNGLIRRTALLSQFGGDLGIKDVVSISLSTIRFDESFRLRGIYTVPEPHVGALPLAMLGVFLLRPSWQSYVNRRPSGVVGTRS